MAAENEDSDSDEVQIGVRLPVARPSKAKVAAGKSQER